MVGILNIKHYIIFLSHQVQPSFEMFAYKKEEEY